jgi:hypothetical protein
LTHWGGFKAALIPLVTTAPSRFEIPGSATGTSLKFTIRCLLHSEQFRANGLYHKLKKICHIADTFSRSVKSIYEIIQKNRINDKCTALRNA